jgi:hypothetical protein
MMPKLFHRLPICFRNIINRILKTLYGCQKPRMGRKLLANQEGSEEVFFIEITYFNSLQ